MEEFQLSKFTKEGEQLLRGVKEEFKRLGIDGSRLPKNFSDDGSKIKLVFVGQFGAGKSSLIKMLTGTEVEIGAGITTQTAASYEWNGLEIIDTPGIHTELRTDHDEITYEQINHAALLIFVITSSGFSQRMGEHFRALAFDRKRADNMVLVVNKMDCTAQGNVPAQQQIICEDLKRVTAPRAPKELYVSFTDTASYFKAQQETDPRRKNRRLERSGYETFVDNLNRFVAEKGVLEKINLPLNTIAAEIRKASENSSAENFSELEELRRERKILVDGKQECRKDVIRIIEAFKAYVSRLGRETAESATSKKSKEEAQKVLDAAQKKVKARASDCANEISVSIQTFGEQTENSFKRYEVKASVGTVDSISGGKFNVEGANEAVQNAAAVVGAGGMAAGTVAFQQGAQVAAQFAKVGITPLGKAAGNAVSVGVGLALKGTDAGIFSTVIGKGAGELVKHLPIFRAEPTMINKIAQAFTGNSSKIFGGVLAGVTTVASLLMLHNESKKAKEAEEELRQARQDVITGFKNLADEVAHDLLYGEEGVNKFLEKNVDPIVTDFDEQIGRVKNLAADEKIKREKLSALLKQTKNLIDEIQACK